MFKYLRRFFLFNSIVGLISLAVLWSNPSGRDLMIFSFHLLKLRALNQPPSEADTAKAREIFMGQLGNVENIENIQNIQKVEKNEKIEKLIEGVSSVASRALGKNHSDKEAMSSPSDEQRMVQIDGRYYSYREDNTYTLPNGEKVFFRDSRFETKERAGSEAEKKADGSRDPANENPYNTEMMGVPKTRQGLDGQLKFIQESLQERNRFFKETDSE